MLSSLLARLSRRPGFLALTIAVLGLGLGAALAVLEVAAALFWRPLPYPGEGRLAFAWQSDGTGARLTVTGADFLAWKTEAGPFEAMAAGGAGRLGARGRSTRSMLRSRG